MKGKNKPIIGLAGGIGSGKSVVARMTESLGAAIIDSDQLSHEQLRGPAVRSTLRAWWGGGVFGPTGEVDRRSVAEIVFQSRNELNRLQRLIYPLIEKRRLELTDAYDADPSVRAIVLDSPKLYEAGLNDECDAVVFVDADRSVRLQRVLRGRGWTEADLDRREKLLNPLDNKRAKADYVIINHSRMGTLRPKVERIFSAVLASYETFRLPAASVSNTVSHKYQVEDNQLS